MEALSLNRPNDRSPFPYLVSSRNDLPVLRPAPALAVLPPKPETQGAGEGMNALLSGLQSNFTGEEEETVSEKAETVTENVSTPTNQAATLGKVLADGKPAAKLAETASKLGGDTAGGSTQRALQGLSSVSDKTGKVGETAFVAAKPFSIANNVGTLASENSTGEEKTSAATGLASDVGYTARTLGAAAEGGTGLSKVSALAGAQSKLLSAAPKAAGALANVGKVAPVLGGVAGVVGGGLDLKDAVSGDKVDKAKLATGGLKVAAGVATAIPGGLPVAMGLGAAALVIENRKAIGKGVKAVGKVAGKAVDKVGDVAGAVADKGKDAVKSIGEKLGIG